MNVRQDEDALVLQDAVGFERRGTIGSFGQDAALQSRSVFSRDLILQGTRSQNVAVEFQQFTVGDFGGAGETFQDSMLRHMLQQRRDVESVWIVQPARHIADSDNLRSVFRQTFRRVAADIAEALYYCRTVRHFHVEIFSRLAGKKYQAATRGFRAAQRTAQHNGFAGDDLAYRPPHLLAVGVHDPRHRLLIGAHVGSRDVAVGTDDVDNLHRVPPREPLQFTSRQVRGINADPAFRAAKRKLHQGAFPGHPHGQCGHFAQTDVFVIPDAALGGSHGQCVLNAITKHIFNVLVVVAAKRDADHGRPLRIQQSQLDILVQVHDLCRAQKLLLREPKHGRIPFDICLSGRDWCDRHVLGFLPSMCWYRLAARASA